MKKIIKNGRGFDFIYGSEIEHLDINWELKRKELAEALRLLLDSPNGQNDANYHVAFDENHVIVLIKNNQNGYEDANFAALVNIENTSPVYKDEENFVPGNNCKYKISYLKPKDPALYKDEETYDCINIMEGIAEILGKNFYTKSDFYDFPWRTLMTGFPVCYKGYYFFAHKH